MLKNPKEPSSRDQETGWEAQGWADKLSEMLFPPGRQIFALGHACNGLFSNMAELMGLRFDFLQTVNLTSFLKVGNKSELESKTGRRVRGKVYRPFPHSAF